LSLARGTSLGIFPSQGEVCRGRKKSEGRRRQICREKRRERKDRSPAIGIINRKRPRRPKFEYLQGGKKKKGGGRNVIFSKKEKSKRYMLCDTGIGTEGGKGKSRRGEWLDVATKSTLNGREKKDRRECLREKEKKSDAWKKRNSLPSWKTSIGEKKKRKEGENQKEASDRLYSRKGFG